MTTPDRTKIQNRADYALQNTPSPNLVLVPRTPTYRPQTPISLHSQNQFSVLDSFPPLPSKLITFSQTVSATSKISASRTSNSSSKSDRLSCSPPPTPPLITQPSKVLHTYKSSNKQRFLL
jgi:hypothetical protein